MKPRAIAYALAVVAGGVTAAASCLPRQNIARFSFADASAIVALDRDAPAAGGGDDDHGSGATILLLEHRYLFQRLHEYSSQVHSEIFTHEVIKLETEAGFERAQVQMGWPKDGSLVSLDARTIAPDGTVTPLQQEDLFALEVKLDKDADFDARVFEFPHVEVGSLLELAYTIDLPGLYTAWESRIADELPIRKYAVDVAVDAVAFPAMRVLNSSVRPTESTDEAGMKHVSFTISDVPARTHERFAPTWRAREPYWLYHTILYKYRPNEIWYTHYDWNDEVRSLAVRKKDGDPLEGTPAIDISKCDGDKTCILRAALDKENALTVFDGFDAFAFEHRPVAEIVSSGKASAGDKAFLYFALLQKAGVDARLAGVARVGSERVDKSFPSLSGLDHTLVVAIFGDWAVWVDPSCEACRPGFLPAWDPVAVGPDGDKVKETLVVTGLEEPKAHWWSLVAPHEDALEDSEVRSVTLRLLDDGSARIAEDDVRTGIQASEWRGDTFEEDDDDARRAAHDALQGLARGAVIEKATRVSCDAWRSRCTRHIEAVLPKYAWRGDGEVCVPLDFLGAAWLLEADRKNDIVLNAAWKSRAELKIVAPAGMTVASLPLPRQARAGIAEVETTVTGAGDTATVTSEVRLQPGRVAKKDVAPLVHALDVGAGAARGLVRLRAAAATTAAADAAAHDAQ